MTRSKSDSAVSRDGPPTLTEADISSERVSRRALLGTFGLGAGFAAAAIVAGAGASAQERRRRRRVPFGAPLPFKAPNPGSQARGWKPSTLKKNRDGGVHDKKGSADAGKGYDKLFDF